MIRVWDAVTYSDWLVSPEEWSAVDWRLQKRALKPVFCALLPSEYSAASVKMGSERTCGDAAGGPTMLTCPAWR